MLASAWSLLARGQQREANNGLDGHGVPHRQEAGDGIQALRCRRALSPCEAKRRAALEPGIRFNGKQKKLSHGAYPSVSLAEARRLRDEAKKLLASGVDPGANKKAARLTAVISATNTFGGIVEEYLQRIEDEGAAASTVTKNRWLLVDLAGPDLGGQPIADITPAEILVLLQRIERTGRRETARRLRSVIGTVFRLAIATLRAKDNPTLLLRGALKAPKVQHRPAIYRREVSRCASDGHRCL